MKTIGYLVKTFNIARSSLLHYEQLGLLIPKVRGNNDYRYYDQQQILRLEQILAYRAYGLSLKQIATLINNSDTAKHQQLLLQHFNVLGQQIDQLQQQQLAIMKLIDQDQLIGDGSMTKQRWVEIMKAAGLSDDAMHQWHVQFERLEPDAHQSFLESLNIDQQEITKIRQWSQQG